MYKLWIKIIPVCVLLQATPDDLFTLFGALALLYFIFAFF